MRNQFLQKPQKIRLIVMSLSSNNNIMFDTGDTWMMASNPVLVLVSDDFKPEDDLRRAHRHSSDLANHAGILNLY
jgi:hypothetical protein